MRVSAPQAHESEAAEAEDLGPVPHKASGRRRASSKAAEPTGADAADSALAKPRNSSQVAKHDRKQKQQKERQKQQGPAGSGGNSSAGGGIAEGQLSARDEEIVKHALTQMGCLKQVAPLTFEIQTG